MRIAIAADHAGVALKRLLVERLQQADLEFLDLGAFDEQPSDYPDFAARVAEAIRSGQATRGILVCGSGVGAAIAANKFRGIRACMCHDTYSARQGVEHDDMNVLCLGGRIVGSELALELARAFISATFHPEPRFVRRLEKILAIEQAERSGTS